MNEKAMAERVIKLKRSMFTNKWKLFIAFQMPTARTENSKDLADFYSFLVCGDHRFRASQNLKKLQLSTLHVYSTSHQLC